MKTTVRRVGNSFGVLIPRATLESWGVQVGDALEISGRTIRPQAGAHERLDALKLAIATEVASRFSPQLIRAKILANLHRWEAQGTWNSAYGEWRELANSDDNGALFAAMLGRDDRANRLRQSAPYVGLLPREVVKRLNEEA